MIDNKESVKTTTVSSVIGARRYRRTSRKGPNWFLIVSSIIITIAISIALGNFLGNYIFGSGRVFKNNGPIPGIVTVDPRTIRQEDNNGNSDNSTINGKERQKVSLPSLILPPGLSDTEQVDESLPKAIDDANVDNNKDDLLNKQDDSVLQTDQQKIDQDKENAEVQEKNNEIKNNLKESYYKVQAGLFLREDNAKTQVTRLAQDGTKAYVERVPKNGSYFYRVQIEGFKDKSTANSKARELSKKGYSTFVIGE